MALVRCAQILICSLAIALAGCSPPETGPEYIDDYLQRLARTLNTPVPVSGKLWAPPRLQDAGVAKLPIPGSKLDVLDFLSLSGCALQVNLGRRNSSLGRTASPSQQLLLDLEFLALAPACIATLVDQGKTDIAAQLVDAQSTRTAFLRQRIFNALLAGPEYSRFWKLPPKLQAYPDQVGGRVIEALHWFNQAIRMWLEGRYEFQVDQLETQLYHLRSGDGGSLLLAAVVQARILEQATAAVDARGDSAPLCPQNLTTGTAKTLATVVVKYFAGQVQPWLARLHQRQRALMPPILGIEAQLEPALPEGYRRWLSMRDATLATLGSMPRQHVTALQRLGASCPGGLLAGHTPQT